ncbi:hypothetical protein [Xanthobacter sediminis]
MMLPPSEPLMDKVPVTVVVPAKARLPEPESGPEAMALPDATSKVTLPFEPRQIRSIPVFRRSGRLRQPWRDCVSFRRL